MDVLHPFVDGELSGPDAAVYRLEFALHGLELLFAEQADAFQHAGVRQRAEHVGLGQQQVHAAVLSHGEAVHLLVIVYVLLPKFHCGYTISFNIFT